MIIDRTPDVDAKEKENDRKRMAAVREVASSTVMDIGINLQAPDLLDLLSDGPTSRTLTINKARPKASKKMNSQEPSTFFSDIQF